MTNVIVTGLWGSGKTTYIREHSREQLNDGREGLVAVSPSLLSGQMFVQRSGLPYKDVCKTYIDRLVLDREAALRALHTSERRQALTPTWIFDGLMFNVPLYGVAEARRDYFALERILHENDTVVKYLRIPAEKVTQVCAENTIASRGAKWKDYLERTAAGYVGGVAAMLLARMTDLERWLGSSPLRVDIIEREWT